MEFFTILVNRSHPLPPDFVPADLVEADIPFDAPAGHEKRMLKTAAARAAKELFSAARQQRLCLWGVSGYRSYARQEAIYRQRLAETSKSYVNSYIARPGTSEHQTGLALDVSCPAVRCQLTEAFADTAEGRWLARNAPLYGFILRYPRGKDEVTGYSWEPWHIRYVTRSLALYLALTGMTLEEYTQLHAGEECAQTHTGEDTDPGQFSG